MTLTIFYLSEASYLAKPTIKGKGIHQEMDTRKQGSLGVLLEVYLLQRPFYIPS